MSYVDAIYNSDTDKIQLCERVDGKRILMEYKPKYEFYYDDLRGAYKNIYGNPVTRITAKSKREFQREVAIHSAHQLYESDINPINKCLEEHYKEKESPQLHTAFFDIETDFHPDKGFSSPSDPFNKVTAIAVYLDWSKQLICLAIPPRGMDKSIAKEIASKFDNTFLFDEEADLLTTFLDLIEDADVLSGWNSEGFDIPYLVNRITRVLSKNDTRRFCLWDVFPKKKKYERYGAEQESFTLSGRIHLDYMDLYRKYTYQEMHSYALDAIAEHELGEKKVAYKGTLDQLYNSDFEKFIDYNTQDTMLLAKMEDKLKFIELANEIAHANTVLIPSTMGSVGVTEQAIINEAHERGMVVPNKVKQDGESVKAAGAYVAQPKTGIHKWIGSVDINSLYPSVIRALNMAPETIIGQIRLTETEKLIQSRMDDIIDEKGKKRKGVSFAGAWDGLFATLEYTAVMEEKPGVKLTVDWVNGESTVHTAYELHEIVFNGNSNWALSSNGTLFTLEREGIIPGLLERWYAERKEMQKKKSEATDPQAKAFWDKRQLVKKIGLNSLYGAILNQHCRFFDKRIGQSTTLSGRTIVKHMSAEVNKVITGEYDHVGKAVIYGDTDSVYFSAWPVLKDDVESGKLEWDIDKCITLYDQVCEQANTTFPDFMARAFHCPKSRSDVIAAGREIVAQSGLYITKKRYAALVIDLEGFRADTDGKPGKVKAMGLDLRRSDTPVFMQEFLSEILLMVLTDASEKEVLERITEFRKDFKERPGYEKGAPKRANKIGHYQRLEQKQGKANMPGHVRASINWNTLKRMNGDKYSQEIVDGMKVIVCKLKQNPLGYTSVAYPTDELRIPDWFKELPFDGDAMEETIIDNKLDNLIGVLDYDLEDTKQNTTFSSLFDFGD